MNISIKEIPKRTIFLILLLVVAVAGASVFIKADNDKYITVHEYHVYEVKTPYGSIRKEIKTDKRFDGGEQMSEAYLQPPASMSEK